MIELQLSVSEGCIRSIEAKGHAPKRETVSLSCAVVSSALRAFALSVHKLDIDCTGSIERPGFFSMHILDIGRKELRGVSTMLITQLETVYETYPDEVRIKAKGVRHGT